MIAAALLTLIGAAEPCLPVDRDRIVAGDLTAAEAAFANVPADTVVAYAPSPGARRVLTIAELTRIAARLNVTLRPTRELCFMAPIEPLSEPRLRLVMLESLHDDEARLEILEFSRYPAPRGVVVFPLSGLARQPLSSPQAPALWRGWVRFGEKRKFRIWARVRVSVPAQRLVARAVLRAGQPIRPDEVEVEIHRTHPSPSKGVLTPEHVAGKLPRRNIPAGAALTAALLADPKPVNRGDLVRVEAQSGAARLQIEGRAQKPGAVGEVIPVRNPASGKNFPARVIARGVVMAGTPKGAIE